MQVWTVTQLLGNSVGQPLVDRGLQTSGESAWFLSRHRQGHPQPGGCNQQSTVENSHGNILLTKSAWRATANYSPHLNRGQTTGRTKRIAILRSKWSEAGNPFHRSSRKIR